MSDEAIERARNAIVRLSCAKCRFFHLERGECRLNPPARLPRQFASHASEGSRVRDETLIWGFPKVNSSDWCGHYIAALRTAPSPEIERAKEALRPFARAENLYLNNLAWGVPLDYELTVSDYRRAAEAYRALTETAAREGE